MSAGTCIYYFKALSNDPKLRWASEEVKQIIITLHARSVARPLRRGPSDRSSLSLDEEESPILHSERNIARHQKSMSRWGPLWGAKVILVHFTHQWFDSVSWIFSHTEKVKENPGRLLHLVASSGPLPPPALTCRAQLKAPSGAKLSKCVSHLNETRALPDQRVDCQDYHINAGPPHGILTNSWRWGKNPAGPKSLSAFYFPHTS